ncbi:MAG TPA: hotdog domain-containing protein [Actinomycetota bacterium]|nr:hotdog domain-containing protein [Actinomycetota bacterium]
MSEPRPGLEAEASLDVTDAVTAARVGSGGVPVLATPEVVALVERAVVAALERALAEGQTTVGARIELDHLAPTPVGGTATARARLDDVDGRRLTFSFTVTDDAGEIARGTHVRVVVDLKRFLAAAGERVPRPQPDRSAG